MVLKPVVMMFEVFEKTHLRVFSERIKKARRLNYCLDAYFPKCQRQSSNKHNITLAAGLNHCMS